jgi:nucleoside-diphosphate-sugar epimerase
LSELGGKRVLVAGAAGFLGANVVRTLLPLAAEVHALVRPAGSRVRLDGLPDLVVHEADVLDRDAVAGAVRAARADLAVNLVAPSGHPATWAERRHMLAVNCDGTCNLVDALAGSDCTRLVHVGSSLEYGSKSQPIREDEVLAPMTFRGAAKGAATLLCLQAAAPPVVVVRPFSVFGPWEPRRRLVPSVICAALEREELRLTAPGYRRDFVYVDDFAEAVLLALEAGPDLDGEIVNVGSGRQTANEEVVAEVERLVGRELAVRPGAYPAQPPDTGFWVADVSKAERTLGWTPRHSLADGLAATIEWFATAGTEVAHAAV